MEDGDTEKYHASSVIQDFVFSSWKMGCIRCISSQVYNKLLYQMMFLLYQVSYKYYIPCVGDSQKYHPEECDYQLRRRPRLIIMFRGMIFSTITQQEM